MQSTMATNPDYVQQATRKVTIEVGTSTFEVEEDKPFKQTLDQIAGEMNMAGSYVINADGKILSKTLPATFQGLEKVVLGKYDAGG